MTEWPEHVLGPGAGGHDDRVTFQLLPADRCDNPATSSPERDLSLNERAAVAFDSVQQSATEQATIDTRAAGDEEAVEVVRQRREQFASAPIVDTRDVADQRRGLCREHARAPRHRRASVRRR